VQMCAAMLAAGCASVNAGTVTRARARHTNTNHELGYQNRGPAR
jgi:hypothetical protein